MGRPAAPAAARPSTTPPARRSGLRVVVGGMLAGVPGHGGASWAVLQYVLGLRDLGHDVLFVEEVDPGPHVTGWEALAASESARYFQAVVGEFGIDDRASLLLAGTGSTVGVPYARCMAFARDADLLVNLSGNLREPELLSLMPLRLYVDLDPAFTQVWSAEDGVDMGLEAHNAFASVGTLLGTDSCSVPTCGIDWLPTLQPVVLDHWPTGARVTRDAFTTVANWRGYGSTHHRGVHYGQKAHSTREILSLPSLTRERITVALSIHREEVADLEALDAHGWEILDPGTIASTPSRYRSFVQASKGEIGIAKSGYARSRCGWFSDRSACYLASGRPVVAQDTGFSETLPTGEGLFSFRTADEAAEAIDTVSAHYRLHSRRAREIAEAYFDSRTVLGRLLERAGAAA